MPKLGPIKRKDLIRYLKQLEFYGPFPGRKHEFMQKGRLRVRIPNPHNSDLSRGLVARILEEAEIEKSVWEDL